MKVLVTGGTGFIGSYIVMALLRREHDLTLLVRNPAKVSGFMGHPRIRFVTGAMDDSEAIRSAVSGQDALIHVALVHGTSGAVGTLLHETGASVYLFEAAAKAGVPKMIYTSSIACFGTAPNRDLGEMKPDTFYGATKAATESYLHAIASQYGVQANVVRPGYTFGSPCVTGGFIYTDRKIKDMVIAARRDEPIRCKRNDGTQFIWAGDLAEIYMRILESDPAHINRRCFTGVSAQFHTWARLGEMIVARLRSKSEILLMEAGLPRVEGLPIDVSQIKEAFGLEILSEQRLVEHIEYLCNKEELS